VPKKRAKNPPRKKPKPRPAKKSEIRIAPAGNTTPPFFAPRHLFVEFTAENTESTKKTQIDGYGGQSLARHDFVRIPDLKPQICADPCAFLFRFLFDIDNAYDNARDKGLPEQACDAVFFTVYEFPFVVNLVASFVECNKREHRWDQTLIVDSAENPPDTLKRVRQTIIHRYPCAFVDKASA
jgi:hypothetical protein